MVLLLLITNQSYCQISDYKVFVNEGKELRDKGRFPLSVEKLHKAIGLDRNCVVAYYEMGRTYSRFNDITPVYGDSCLYYFQRAFEIDSNYGELHACLGRIKGVLHDFNGALYYLNIALKKQPDTALYTSRALVEVKLNDMNAACKDFTEAIKLGSKLSRKIVSYNLLGVDCSAYLQPSCNVQFLRAVETGSGTDKELLVILQVTSAKSNDFPPVVSAKIIYSLDKRPSIKADFMRAQDGISITIYGNNVKEKSEQIYNLVKDRCDLKREHLSLFVFSFRKLPAEKVEVMSMTYGFWEKNDQDLRVERKYDFKVE